MFGIQGCSAIYDVTLTMLFRHIPPQFKLVSYYIGFCIGLICIYGTMYTYIIHGVACARLRCTLTRIILYVAIKCCVMHLISLHML